MVSIRFKVQLKVKEEDCVVCIVGSIPELGDWEPKKAKVMHRVKKDLWTKDVYYQYKPTIDPDIVQYRYFVCQPLNDTNKKIDPKSLDDLSKVNNFSIVRWESTPTSRSLNLSLPRNENRLIVSDQTADPWDYILKPKVSQDFQCQNSRAEALENSTNVPQVALEQNIWSSGWLHNVCEIRLRLCGDNPVNIWDLDTNTIEVYVKCKAVDYCEIISRQKTDLKKFGETQPSREAQISRLLNACAMPVTSYMPGGTKETPTFASDLLVSELSRGDPRPKVQGQYGSVFVNGDYLSFKIQTAKPEGLGFRCEYFVDLEVSMEMIGYSYLLPLPFIEGVKKVPIFNNHAVPIGDLTVNHMIIFPTPGLSFNMEISYQNFWNGGYGMDAGHRGFGSSFKPKEEEEYGAVKENTIAAMKMALSHGVKFVEFDVLLCKERIPVIFHDFYVNLSYIKRHTTPEHELYNVGVHDLSLAQLQSCKLYHASQVSMTLHEEIPSQDWDPFPTLEQCLTNVDNSLGYILEIKYPQSMITGDHEVLGVFFDRNTYLDKILAVLFEHAGKRKIIITSFDSDTCVMLQLKQNKYPVLFLNQGETDAYVPYADYCASSFRNALQFAVSERLLGVDLNSDELLKELDILSNAAKLGLVVFVWGHVNNDPKVKELLKRHQVAVIISDDVKTPATEAEKPTIYQIPQHGEKLPDTKMLLTRRMSQGSVAKQSFVIRSRRNTSSDMQS